MEIELKIIVGIVIAGAILLYKRYGSSVSMRSVSASGVKSFGGKTWIILKKVFKWFTFWGIVKMTGFVFVIYFIVGLGYEGRYFWQPSEYTSRFQTKVIKGNDEAVYTVYIIPKISPELENEIILTKTISFRFSKGNEPEIFFPGAKLIQSYEESGDAAGRRFANLLFGQDIKEPMGIFKDSIKPEQQKGNVKDAVVFLRGDRIVFSERREHKIYLRNGILGDMLHMNYHFVKRKF